MTDEGENNKKVPPKGGAPKGGTRFPRYALKECVDWAKKLVGKTHGGPQPAEIIYASVVDSKGPRGEIKASALKQFNLMNGPKEAYVATASAKSIAAAPSEELNPLLRTAALSPTLFKSLFDTFHGDTVPTSKLRQRAAELNVHPDNLDAAVSVYVASCALANLVSVEGDKVTHQVASVVSDNGDDNDKSENVLEALEQTNGESDKEGQESISPKVSSPRAIFHVNVNLDASLDTEKLEKHLALLKRYGAI